jgi:hypothetical protein
MPDTRKATTNHLAAAIVTRTKKAGKQSGDAPAHTN